jgi:hypothetical protein
LSARGGQVAAERFFNDDARLIRQACSAEPLDHRLEQCGRDGQIVRRAPGIPQCLLERIEGAWLVVVAVDVAQQGEQMAQGRPIIDGSCFTDPVLGVLLQLRQIPC